MKIIAKKQREMKRLILVFICLLFFSTSYSFTPSVSENLSLNSKFDTKTIELNTNYQQFKYQVINLETADFVDYASLKRRRKKQDHLMLYVAGGLAVATGVLILANDPENFVSNSTSGVNLGIAVGGTLACGMIVAKYFIDRGR